MREWGRNSLIKLYVVSCIYRGFYGMIFGSICSMAEVCTFLGFEDGRHGSEEVLYSSKRA